jgi:hypothetical protein
LLIEFRYSVAVVAELELRVPGRWTNANLPPRSTDRLLLDSGEYNQLLDQNAVGHE